MFRLNVFFTVLLLFVFSAALSFAAVDWTGLGPPGTVNLTFIDITVDPTDADVVYLLAKNNADSKYLVYRSNDGGINWELSHNSVFMWGSDGYAPFRLYCNPVSPEVVYVTKANGIWRSEDQGFTWDRKIFNNFDPTPIKGGTYGFAVSPVNPMVIYRGANRDISYGDYRLTNTTNEGVTWKYFTGSYPQTGTFFPCIAAHPTDEARALAGGSMNFTSLTDGGLWLTTNEGSSWEKIFSISDTWFGGSGYDATVAGIRFNVSDPNEIVAAQIGDTKSPKFYRSLDGGNTFSSKEMVGVSFTSGSSTIKRGAFRTDPDDFSRKYYGFLGIWRSEDPSGEVWVESDSGIPSGNTVYGMDVSISSPEVLYAVTDYGPYKSANKAGSWTSINSGLSFGNVAVVKMPKTMTSRLYVSVGDKRTSRSNDYGNNWTDGGSFYTGTSPTHINVDPNDPDVVYFWAIRKKNVYKSTNALGTLNVLDLDVDSIATKESIRLLQIDPVSSEVLYCQISSSTPEETNPRLIKSIDGGSNWSTLVTGTLEQADVLVINPVSPEVMYKSSFGEPGWEIKRSTDGGSSWTDLSFPASTVEAMGISPNDPRTLYVGVNGSGTLKKVYKSTDEGESFIGTGNFSYLDRLKDLAVNPQRSGILYALVGDRYICRSVNGGASWSSDIAGGLPSGDGGVEYISDIELDPKTDMYLYAATDKGLYVALELDYPAAPSIETVTPHYVVNLTQTNIRIDGNYFISPHITKVLLRKDAQDRELEFAVASPLQINAIVPYGLDAGTYEVFVEANYGSTLLSNPATIEMIGASPDGPTIEAVRFDGRMYLGPSDPVSRSPNVRARIKDHQLISPSGFEYLVISADDSSFYKTATLEASVFTPSGIDTAEGEINFQVSPAIASGTYDFVILARDKATSEAYPEGNVGVWSGRVDVEVGDLKVIGDVLSYPAPFKALGGENMIISYNLNRDADVTVYVFDISGQVVLTRKFSEGQNGGHAGYNQFEWNGVTDFGNALGNGIYIVRVTSGHESVGSGRIVVLD